VCSGVLAVRVAFRIEVAFIREQVCLGFAYLLLDFFLRPDWLFWVSNNCLNVDCNQSSILDNIDSIPTEEVTKLLNNLGMAKLLCVQCPILKVFPKVLLKLVIGVRLLSVV
jgi:hypothetical protein